ncbi:pectate lyase [Philodulcilactobacillus myokoensis]|uniref:Pectate lyase n=1 Tax=Philodulcilactobacillus myokoensis TaxID=2929573 RepID=A0A9W6ERX3_9LACO|nr:pectate lyase [Philodulcilactobacillus myokoensis]GLB46325.1 pectate lyase [Philodulcilactobacillus myokoensis]
MKKTNVIFLASLAVLSGMMVSSVSANAKVHHQEHAIKRVIKRSKRRTKFHRKNNRKQVSQTLFNQPSFKTTGGNQKGSKKFTVTSAVQLRKAIKANVQSRTVYIKGTIDMQDGKTADDYAQNTGYDFQQYLDEYNPDTYGRQEVSGVQEKARHKAQEQQAKDVEIHVPANTSIIGLKNAHLKNANLMVENNNVIIKNLNFQSPVDDFPQWDPTDGSTGNWNSQYDCISVKGASNVWIDHNTFNDQPYSDANEGTYFGRDYQHHDGMTDITDGANNVTLSNNVYQNHDKTILIGSSDSKHSDANQLHVNIIGNEFKNTVQRTPRVRYGTVNVINNYYDNQSKGAYQFSYAWGIGKNSKVNIQNNVLNVDAKPNHLISKLGGKSFRASGNVLNGKAIKNLNQIAKLPSNHMKSIKNILPTNQVKAHVVKNAGNR